MVGAGLWPRGCFSPGASLSSPAASTSCTARSCWQQISNLTNSYWFTFFFIIFFPLSSPPEESNKKHPFPCPTSYRTALTYYLDITNPPRTNVLYELAQYATDSSEQERLRKMASSSAEGKVRAAALPAELLG